MTHLCEQLEAWNRKPHNCDYKDGDGGHGYCEEEKGKLNLVIDDGCESQGMYVPFCPFCGYKVKNKEA